MIKLLLRRFFLLLIGLGVVALIVYAFMPKPVPVDIGEVTRGDLVVTVDEDGITRIKKWSEPYKNGSFPVKEPYRYLISAPLDGFLMQIQLEPGDEVQAGKTVAELRPRPPALLDVRAYAEAIERKNAAIAMLAKASAQKKLAEKEHQLTRVQLNRANRLLPNSISQEDYDIVFNKAQLAEQRLNVAEAGLRVADHEVKIAEAALLHLKNTATLNGNKKSNGDGKTPHFQITTPMSGKVLKVYQEFRGQVTAGTKLLEIGDTKQLEVVVDVLSDDAVKIKKGTRVFLEQWGGEKPLYAHVRLVEPGAFLKISALGVEEQRVNVIIDLDEQANAKIDRENHRNKLGDAYRVQARIVIWEGNDVLKVPAGALFRHKKKWAVFVVRDNTAVLREVIAGRSSGLETEINRGLNPGDKVILHPSDQVKDGVQVYGR